MEKEIRAYEGNDGYAVVAYVSSNKGQVIEYLLQLQNQGSRLWFDNQNSSKLISQKINNANLFILFYTQRCDKDVEIHDLLKYAINHDKKIVILALEEVTDYLLNDLYCIQLFGNKFMDNCRVIHNILQFEQCAGNYKSNNKQKKNPVAKQDEPKEKIEQNTIKSSDGLSKKHIKPIKLLWNIIGIASLIIILLASINKYIYPFFESKQKVYNTDHEIHEQSSVSTESKTEIDYVKESIDEAARIYEETEDYEEAIRVLQESGLENVEITNEINRYREYAPISLLSLTPIKCDKQIETYAPFDNQDVQKNIYDEHNVIVPQRYFGGIYYTDEESNSISFYLNNEYTTLEGLVYIPYRTLSFEDSWDGVPWEGIAKIYGDDRLLYSAQTGPKIYTSTPFTVDVTGVRELKIVLIGMGKYQYDDCPAIALTNLMLQK